MSYLFLAPALWTDELQRLVQAVPAGGISPWVAPLAAALVATASHVRRSVAVHRRKSPESPVPPSLRPYLTRSTCCGMILLT